jgi:hypothetical protein
MARLKRSLLTDDERLSPFTAEEREAILIEQTAKQYQFSRINTKSTTSLEDIIVKRVLMESLVEVHSSKHDEEISKDMIRDNQAETASLEESARLENREQLKRLFQAIHNEHQSP